MEEKTLYDDTSKITEEFKQIATPEIIARTLALFTYEKYANIAKDPDFLEKDDPIGAYICRRLFLSFCGKLKENGKKRFAELASGMFRENMEKWKNIVLRQFLILQKNHLNRMGSAIENMGRVRGTQGIGWYEDIQGMFGKSILRLQDHFQCIADTFSGMTGDEQFRKSFESVQPERTGAMRRGKYETVGIPCKQDISVQGCPYARRGTCKYSHLAQVQTGFRNLEPGYIYKSFYVQNQNN